MSFAAARIQACGGCGDMTWVSLRLRSNRIKRLIMALFAVHTGLLGWGALRHGPGWNEPCHLVAGISHWQLGRFDLYRVNPPLVRSIAAVPALLAGVATDWKKYDASVGARSERRIVGDFLSSNKERIFWLHTLARWACVPLSLLGGYIALRWAADLYGRRAGVLALALWCFSPNIVASGQMITPDAGAAALGVAASYLFWRWLKGPSWTRACGAGVVLGLAELSKTTWVVLFVLWPVLWLACRRRPVAQRTEDEPRDVVGGIAVLRKWESCQLAVVLLLGLYVLNLGYLFEGTFQRLGDYRFVSRTLGGSQQQQGRHTDEGRNRFADTWLAAIRVPLPKNYLMGIDLQKSDFERKMLSYVGGEWRIGGWWYYYLYALAIKVPLGTWLLVLLALLVGLFGRRYAADWRDELVLLAPIVVILTLVSSQTGFNHHLRYLLPIFPFAFIWISKVARAVQFGHRKIASVAAAALLWSVASSLWVYPHSLSYFNELVGGPTGGHAHLGGVAVDSNIDWGQDLLYLKRWLQGHPEASPLHLAFNGSYDANLAGIEYTPPATEPQPGWHALSVNKIRSQTRQYEYFLKFEPVAMAGYSIYIYHVTLEDANRIRREQGRPELPMDWQENRGEIRGDGR